jgi:hypothetical protein
MRVSGELREVSFNWAESALGNQIIAEVVGICEEFSQPHSRF